MEYHQNQLTKHCRVCGGRLFNSKWRYKATVYQVDAFHDQFQMAFGIAAREDSPLVHPKSFCKSCKVAMGRLVDSKTKGVPYRSTLQLYKWEVHKESCKV